MLMSEESIVCLTKHIRELYFLKHDYQELIPFLSDEMTWTNHQGMSLHVQDTIKFINRYSHVFEILEESYQARQINCDVWYVMVTMIVKIELEKMQLEYQLHLTVIWVQENHFWKIIHIHSSSYPKDDLNGNLSSYHNMLETIERIKYTDTVTSIHNLQGFEKDVKEIVVREPDKKYALIKLSVRDFRFINHKYGYQMGDKILRNIAANLCHLIKGNETCGRIEKDIFAVFCCFHSYQKLEKRIEQMNQRLIDKNIFDQLGIQINMKYGVYIVEDTTNICVKDILDKAMIALKNENSAFHEYIVYYEESMMNRHHLNSQILEDASNALKKDKFELYIQPQFEISTGQITGGEVLTRWKLENQNIRMPSEFITLFEKHGFILLYDFYILEKLCKQIRVWLDEGREVPSLSINQSRLHIENKNYLDDFCAVLDRYQIPHHLIIFELTESAFIDNNEKMMILTHQLHEHGFQLAIDDFGSGYASLNQLSHISADIIKIDHLLIKDFQTNKKTKIIIEKIIEMAHQMNMVVICEGVETQEQLQFLKELKCDFGQGYLIGRPIEAREFAKKWIKGGTGT